MLFSHNSELSNVTSCIVFEHIMHLTSRPPPKKNMKMSESLLYTNIFIVYKRSPDVLKCFRCPGDSLTPWIWFSVTLSPEMSFITHSSDNSSPKSWHRISRMCGQIGLFPILILFTILFIISFLGFDRFLTWQFSFWNARRQHIGRRTKVVITSKIYGSNVGIWLASIFILFHKSAELGGFSLPLMPFPTFLFSELLGLR